MADRYDMDRDRDRDRERSGKDWDRGRDWNREQGRDFGDQRYAGDRNRDDWDRDRERRFNNEGRYGEAGFEDYGWQRRNEQSRDFERGDYNTRGDWGRQGSWGNYGNRPDFSREAEWRNRGMDPGRSQSDFGGYNTNRTNLYGTGGGGFGTGSASYGAGMGNYGGSGSFGGGMSSYGERGRHAGRGPKGWQRADDRIRDDINERLTDHPHIDASEIEVAVKNGEVTLSGTVDDRQAKRMAEDIAESVSGVREVHNQIRVQMLGQGQTEHSKVTSTTGTTTRK